MLSTRRALCALPWSGWCAATGLGAPAPAPVPGRAVPGDSVVLLTGAAGDGRTDDTGAIQRALDRLRPGQRLVFPPATCCHSARLVVRRAGVTLDGRGARLHALNPDDQALQVTADGVLIEGFTLTAVTDGRRLAPWHSRIAVWREDERPIVGVRIVGNRIVEAGEPGSAGANSSSSAGIFLQRARRFRIEGNTVRRSLADGIHITGGSRQGRVVGNTVRETGDDLIAVVSYLGVPGTRETAAAVARTLESRRSLHLVRHIVVADNHVAGNYWGRGIAVVGGEDVLIARNAIADTSHGAGVYIAREQGYATFGVRRVRVEGNTIRRVQTTDPAYTTLAPPLRTRRAGHGAIELVAHQFDQEAVVPALRDALSVREVQVVANRIERAETPAIRIGWGHGLRELDMSAPGAPRTFAGAAVTDVELVDNRIHDTAQPLVLFNAGDPALRLSCEANRVDGRALSHPACRRPDRSDGATGQPTRGAPNATRR